MFLLLKIKGKENLAIKLDKNPSTYMQNARGLKSYKNLPKTKKKLSIRKTEIHKSWTDIALKYTKVSGYRTKIH